MGTIVVNLGASSGTEFLLSQLVTTVNQALDDLYASPDANLLFKDLEPSLNLHGH